MVARDREPRPGGDKGPPPEGELHRLWSPEQLRELEASRLRYGIGRVASRISSDVLDKKIKPATAVRRLRELADWIEEHQRPKLPQPKQNEFALEHSEPAPSDAVLEVFRFWQQVTGRRNTSLTPSRRKAIEARLKHFTVAQLKLVISRAHESRFWSGEKSNDGAALDLEAYMGSHRHVEQLLHEAKETGQQLLVAADNSIDAEIEALEDRATELVAQGRIEEANDIQADIERRLAHR